MVRFLQWIAMNIHLTNSNEYKKSEYIENLVLTRILGLLISEKQFKMNNKKTPLQIKMFRTYFWQSKAELMTHQKYKHIIHE